MPKTKTHHGTHFWINLFQRDPSALTAAATPLFKKFCLMFSSLRSAYSPAVLRAQWRQRLLRHVPSRHLIVPPTTKYERFEGGGIQTRLNANSRSKEPFYKNRRMAFVVAGASGLMVFYYVTHLEKVPMSNRTRFMTVSPGEEEQIGKMAYYSLMTKFRGRVLMPHNRVPVSLQNKPQCYLKTNHLREKGKLMPRLTKSG
jgi:hypothetical protein